MHSQRGFALLELIVACLLATLLAVWGAQALVNRLNDAGAQAHAAWMLALRKAALGYIERYAPALAGAEDEAALSGSGYADWARPGIAELKADALLSPGFPDRGPQGAGAALRLLRYGNCPGPECRIEALVHSSLPFTDKRSGDVDEQKVAQWLMASQGLGGWVSGLRPAIVGGAAFAYDNPPWAGPPLPPGTVALAVTGDQLRELDFLRVRDARDPDFQGGATIQGTLRTGADLRVDGYFYLDASEQALAPCEEAGAISREADGGMLLCRDGLWRPLGRSGSGGFSTHQWRGCQNSVGTSTANPVTGACSCPPNSAMVQISDSGPQQYPEGRTLGFLCVD